MGIKNIIVEGERFVVVIQRGIMVAEMLVRRASIK